MTNILKLAVSLLLIVTLIMLVASVVVKAGLTFSGMFALAVLSFAAFVVVECAYKAIKSEGATA